MVARHAAALFGAMTIPLILGGCIASGTNITGATGVGVDSAGGARLVMALCEGSIGFVDLYGPRQGDERTPQEPVGSWTAKEPITSAAVLDLAAPDARWTVVRTPDLLERGVLYSAFAGSIEDDEQLQQVDFTLEQLDTLDLTQVRWARSPQTSATTFQETVCPRRARLPVGP